MTIEQPKNEPPLSPSTLHPASPPREPQIQYPQKPSSGEIWRHKEGGLYQIINVEKSSMGIEYVHYSPLEGNDVHIRDMAQIMKNFRKVGK